VKIALTLTVFAVLALSASEVGKAEDQLLQKEIETLKAGQGAIQKDIAEIKALLIRSLGDSGARALPQSSKISLENALSQGQKNAPVTLVEFTDFQCPYCKVLFEQTIPQILSIYVNSGKIRYLVKDFPLESIHANALKASEAVHCADAQGKGWDMHTRLFENQNKLGTVALIEHAEALGLDKDKFEYCLDSGQFSEAVRKSIAEGKAAGVNGTPSIFLGTVDPITQTMITERSIVGAQPIAVFRTAIDEQLLATKK